MNEPISLPNAGHLGDPYLLVQTPKMVSQGNKTPRRSLPRVRTSSGFSNRVAWALFGAGHSSASPADRRKAQLLSALNVVLGVPLLLGALELGMVEARPGAAYLPWLLGAGALCAAVAYGLSRTRHVRLATGVSIALLWLGPAAYVVLEAQRAQAVSVWASVWLAVPIVVAGAIARPSTSVIVGSAAIIVPPAAAYGATAEAALGPSAFLACVGAVTFVLSCHRESVEGDRLGELMTKSAELGAEARALKKRLDARTAEVRKVRDELDKLERVLSDQRGALVRSESFATITRQTADVVHESRAPMQTMLSALAEARALADEYARGVDDPDMTDSDHRALAGDLSEALDVAKQAAERSAALVHTADMELHLAGKVRVEAQRRA